jgi:hypothetical protein
MMKILKTSPAIGRFKLPNQLASYLEVVGAAKLNEHFEDFKTGGRLSGDIRNGYQARMVAFSDLFEHGFVKLESGLMVLGTLTPAPWLTKGLLNGDIESWKFCDTYPAKARKFKPDQYNLEQIGRDGEDFVISWLKENLESQLHSSIVHTSLTDDSAGYDIVSPSAKLEGRILLEVKTTTRPGDEFTFHLSRNEWSTALRNPNWHLILVRKIQGSFSFFGYLDNKSLVNYYPHDRHQNFQWTSVVGKLGPDDIFSGFPGF